jgi:hypothetical protein
VALSAGVRKEACRRRFCRCEAENVVHNVMEADAIETSIF